jgi:uncharacterized membrane protein
LLIARPTNRIKQETVMTQDWIVIPCAAAVIASAMSAGLFYTFSDFQIRAMRLATLSAGVEVMQNINREIMRSGTIVVLWGSLALSVLLGLYAVLVLSGPAVLPLSLGAALFILGVWGVSVAFNIPMNMRLAGLEHTSTKAAAYWAVYVSRWNFWNHVRSATAILAAICFLIGGLMLA